MCTLNALVVTCIPQNAPNTPSTQYLETCRYIRTSNRLDVLMGVELVYKPVTIPTPRFVFLW